MNKASPRFASSRVPPDILFGSYDMNQQAGNDVRSSSPKQASVNFSQKFLEQDREVSIIVTDNASQRLCTSMEDLPKKFNNSPYVPKRESFNIGKHVNDLLEGKNPRSICDTSSQFDRQLTNELGTPSKD